MKIDIHTHTRKTKTGDAPTRDISPKDFCEKILSTEVRVVAITNHNFFDLEQFKEIVKIMNGDAQVWPGVELDISEPSAKSHLLVIVSPRFLNEFSDAVNKITEKSNPDAFMATIEQVLETFDSLNPLYVAHYKQKFPSMSDATLEKLEAGTRSPECVLKEVTNSISAGIYISHGHPSIYGSDVHDWGKYGEQSHALPDLRLPIDSFEHFCLFLKKDQTTINTALNRKISEDIDLNPFDDGSVLRLQVFNDINVVFGPKGTGKSCILKSLAKHYSANGIDAKVYESASDKLDDIFNIKGKGLAINLDLYGINYCLDEIKSICNAVEVGVTGIAKYISFFNGKSTNKNAKKIFIKDIEPEEESGRKGEFLGFNSAAGKVKEFIVLLEADDAINSVLSDVEKDSMIQSVSSLLGRLKEKRWTTYSEWKEIYFLNSAIKKFRQEIERKTGSPANPVSTGFKEYALNRISIEVNAARILKSVNTLIPMQMEYVGSLGANKGELKFVTELKFQNGTVSDGSFSSLTAVTKQPQKNFIKLINDIYENVYTDALFGLIASLNDVDGVEGIPTVLELLLIKRYFSLNGQLYYPSSGESSMLMLQKELGSERDVYILDEPERSLGNEYISDVIVPLIRERARSGKRIFISTHDANIAVRTLPYSSVYRCHDQNGYKTYVGNPFSNDLVNIESNADRLDWKLTSMRTLEGGKEAFGERGKIYGKN